MRGRSGTACATARKAAAARAAATRRTAAAVIEHWAATEAMARTEPASFVATRRVQCFLGELGEPGEDGKRRKVPSLAEEVCVNAMHRRCEPTA